MLGRPHTRIEDERGSTMIELLVGLAMGMVVLVGLTMTLIVVLHGNARVDARVEATDNARLTVTRIIEELHSACVSPKIAPVKGGSSGDKLVFWHAAGSAGDEVDPEPVESEIVYSPATESLSQTDYAAIPETEWEFDREPGSGETRILLSNVSPPAAGGIFSYSKYVDGKLEQLAAAGELGAAAESVIFVGVALTAAPRSTPVADAGADATVQDGATLRLTPPSYIEETEAPPCE